MPYRYEDHRAWFLEPKAEDAVVKAKRFAAQATTLAGCVRAEELMSSFSESDSWKKMAVVDRLVETEYLFEIQQTEKPMWQGRIFVHTGKAWS